MKGRKHGCPVNVRDWAISIEDKAQSSETFIRIKGLTQMTRSTDADTEDGSAATDAWEEPYVTKRSGSLSLEGRPIVDAETGDRDAGQSMLDDYGNEVGCDGDATIKMVDPYGMAIVADYVVTGTETSADDTENSVSWDLEQVGEPEVLPYVQLTDVELQQDDTEITELAMEVGGTPDVVNVVFTPADSSNQRYRVTSSNKRKVAVSNITENSFMLTALADGEATITVTTVNNAKTASITVTVGGTSGAETPATDPPAQGGTG